LTTAPYIHATALQPIEFIPSVQDVDAFTRRRMAIVEKDEQAIARRITALNIKRREGRIDSERDNPGCEEEADAIEKEKMRIADDRLYVESSIISMREKYPTPQRFTIAVPTTVEREQISSRLVSMGLTQVTQEQIRATMIEELYNVDWRPEGHEGEWDPLENEAVAEDKANFLDGCWLRQTAHDNAIDQWNEQEIERITDEAEGAPPRPRAELPPKIITVRESARMELTVADMMMRSQKLRNLAAANMDFSRRNAMLLLRIHVMAVNFETGVPIERDRFTRAISLEAVNALREKVDDTSWDELVTFVNRLYILDGGEEKNSGSRHENLPLPSGSTEPSVGQADSGGSSTTSSSTPAPDVGSEKTTDRSSDSTIASEAAPESSPAKPSLTVVD